jgi:hypothetical protein
MEEIVVAYLMEEHEDTIVKIFDSALELNMVLFVVYWYVVTSLGTRVSLFEQCC